ncbi:hypothetical protein [Falsiroseomonas selenitidurans]|uniref:Secreted protein n=1 Tax=Falsiroseomonas selenitidurans TaxID=2716335 RepID=A0ABX1EH77_9PROT|nr:hypothetical protein [Falsiroseomonas selenitidurans]NKC34210.1 hypothetical protein [Falsiroseomonas selenitidurans]OYW09228.1 MAG: hypothetical protein B7Z53_03350 [Rhodospirillales bacterium 12-71-4]
MLRAMGKARMLLAMVVLAGILLPRAPAAESPPPACTAAREGVAQCIAGKLCICRFLRGGSLTGRPDRFNWDCGVLRPACGPGLVPPALQGPAMPLPDMLLAPAPWGAGPGGKGR